MRASENPFFVLKASTRDRKSRLLELGDEAALHGDHDAAVNARNVLSNPRTRLAAEIGWFPGVSPKRVAQLLEHIEQGRYPAVAGMNPLCRANFSVEALKLRAAKSSSDLQAGIEDLAAYVEELDVEEVLLAVNEDRQAAGIPAVTDSALVEAEISDRVRHFERVITAHLEDLPSAEMVRVYTSLVSRSTNEGTNEGARLVEALIDGYELKASGSFLNDEAARIRTLIQKAQTAADNHASAAQVRANVVEIIQSLRIWDSVAQPIQLAHMSRGLSHDDSKRLAFSARSLAIHLFNEHDYLDDAKLLSEALQELFSEVATVNDTVQEDIVALENIANHRAESQRKSAQDEAEFARDIIYETTFGKIFKDKFRISPHGFDYKGLLTPLDKITGVRWGAVRNSVNGIPTGTNYFFGYITPVGSIVIQPNERQYKEIIQRAWRAVGFPILIRWMEAWSKGQSVKVGGLEIKDDGLVLSRTRFLKEDERLFFPWSALSKSVHNGNLSFFGKPDKRFTATLSYKDVWNVHIFDFAIDKIWEGKAAKLSKIFGD